MSQLNANAKEFVPKSSPRPPYTNRSQTSNYTPVAPQSFSNRLFLIRNDGPSEQSVSESSNELRHLPVFRGPDPQMLQNSPSTGSSYNQSNFSYTHSNNDLNQSPFLTHNYLQSTNRQQQPSSLINESRSNSNVEPESLNIDLSSIHEEMQKIEAESKALRDFESLIKVLVETPAEFDYACEYIVYLISPHLKNRPFMQQLVTILIGVAWDVNFHYSAALLSKKLDIISPVFKEELFEAIDCEINREVSNLASISLFVSELFYVFKPDIFPQFYRCLTLLIKNTKSNENVKTACKLLKLNGCLLSKQYPREFNTIVQQLQERKSEFSDNIREFVDRTLTMIEMSVAQANSESENVQSVGGGGGGGDATNSSVPQQSIPSQQLVPSEQLQQQQQQPQQPQQQQSPNQSDSFISFVTNAGENDLVGELNANHDSGVGAVFYGPDQKPLTQEELNFLSVSDEVSSYLDDYIQREINTVMEDDMPSSDVDNVDYYAPN